MNLVLENVEEITPVILHPPPMRDEEYFVFCQQYERFQVERMADGSVVVMAPNGLETGYRNNDISKQLGLWADSDGRGVAFDSNSEFILGDSSALSPDASWVEKDRINQLSRQQKERFPRLCPDFVIELMPPSDRVSRLQKKMRQWIDNGVGLGWLIDPDRRTVYIYKPGTEVKTLNEPDQIRGEGSLIGFSLDLKRIWAGL